MKQILFGVASDQKPKKVDFSELARLISDYTSDYQTFLRLKADEIKKNRPIYSGNPDKVIEVSQKEQAVTRASDEKPVLATFGIGPCVSLVGYDPKTQIGFLTHYDGGTDLQSSFTSLLYALNRAGATTDGLFEVRIISNESSGPSAQIISKLRILTQHGTCLPMKIVEEDIVSCMEFDSKDIALDTRTGEVFNYDPKINPNRALMPEFRIGRLFAFGPAEISYEPK